MEHSSDESTLENEFVRKLSVHSVPSHSNEPCCTLVSDSKLENRDEEELLIYLGREIQGESPSTLSTLVCGATGSTGHNTITMIEKTRCPCCQQSFDRMPSTLNEPRLLNRHTPSLFTLTDEENNDDTNINEDMLPGTLGEGIQYHPTGVLVQGWLHKKGTGRDWLGSTSWKARWARVVTAKVDGYSCEVPLMQIYWHSSAPIPSTVILLESTVVLSMDLSDKDQWDSFRFEIRHAATKENPTISVTRTFTAPKLSRDTWVYMISEALLSFEKNMSVHRKINELSSTLCGERGSVVSVSAPPSSPESLILMNRCFPGKVASGDRSSSPGIRRRMCPPSRLPRSNRSKQGSQLTERPRGPRIPRLAKEKATGLKSGTSKTDINEWYVYPPTFVASKSEHQVYP